MLNEMKKLAQDAILVTVGVQHDGAAYELDPFTRLRLQTLFPDDDRLPAVFLGHRRNADFPRLQRPHWETVVRLLTGLTDEQITDLGGARIYSPAEGKVLWEWKPRPVTIR